MTVEHIAPEEALRVAELVEGEDVEALQPVVWEKRVVLGYTYLAFHGHADHPWRWVDMDGLVSSHWYGSRELAARACAQEWRKRVSLLSHGAVACSVCADALTGAFGGRVPDYGHRVGNVPRARASDGQLLALNEAFRMPLAQVMIERLALEAAAAENYWNRLRGLS